MDFKRGMRGLLLTLLETTRKRGATTIDDVSRRARIPAGNVRRILKRLGECELIKLDGSVIKADMPQRLKLAVEAIKAGIDVERVARKLDWREFEELVLEALNANNYKTWRHLVFKHKKSRYEIDVIGVKEPLLICVDCKHWKHGWSVTRIALAARKQLERVEAISKEIARLEGKLKIKNFKNVVVMPVILTLADTPWKIHEGVPIVSILRMRSFLYGLNPFADGLTKIVVKLKR
jgi:Holliday junction resolvase-like predicted endonuclease